MVFQGSHETRRNFMKSSICFGTDKAGFQVDAALMALSANQIGQ